MPVALTLFLLAGCRVVDAPDSLEELAVFGFVHFDDDLAYLEAVGDKLFPAVGEIEEELSEGYYVDRLTAAHLEQVGVEAADTEGIVGALGRAVYTHELVPVACGITWPEKATASSYDNYVEYELEDDGNLDCFLEGRCDRYDSVAHQVIDVPILGEVTQTFERDFRWVTTSEGVSWIAARSLSPEPAEFTTELLAVDQQYAFFALEPHQGATRRVEAFWVEAHALGFELPEAYAVDTAVGEMQDQADRIDDFLDAGEGCQ